MTVLFRTLPRLTVFYDVFALPCLAPGRAGHDRVRPAGLAGLRHPRRQRIQRPRLLAQ